jgi:hypothetical protein
LAADRDFHTEAAKILRDLAKRRAEHRRNIITALAERTAQGKPLGRACVSEKIEDVGARRRRAAPASAAHTDGRLPPNLTEVGPMAPTTNHTNAELANVLIDHADSLIDGGKTDQGIEPFVRLAAERLRRPDEPMPEVVALITRLRQVAHETHDGTTADALRAMLGEYATV